MNWWRQYLEDKKHPLKGEYLLDALWETINWTENEYWNKEKTIWSNRSRLHKLWSEKNRVIHKFTSDFVELSEYLLKQKNG